MADGVGVPAKPSNCLCGSKPLRPVVTERRALRLAVDVVFYAALATFLYTAAARGIHSLDPPLNGDTSRDFLLAHQCLEGETCFLKGARTSTRFLSHSGMWVLHLATAEWLGLSAPDVYLLALALFVAAQVLLVFFQERLFGGDWLSRRLRAAVVASVFAATGSSSDLSDMFAAIQCPLPSAALVVATVTAVRTRSAWAWLTAALSFSLVIQGHAAGGLYLPVLAGLYLWRPPARPLRVALGGSAVMLGSILLLSRDAALEWPKALAAFGSGGGGAAYVQGGFEPSTFFFLAGGGGLVLLVAARLRGSLGPATRALLSLGVVPSLVLCGVGTATWFSPHYAKPYILAMRLVAGLALVEASLLLGQGLGRLLASGPRPGLSRLGARLPQGALGVALALTFGLPTPTGLDSSAFLTYGDLEALLPPLRRAGIVSLEDAFVRLGGPERLNLSSNLHLKLPRHRPASAGDPAGLPLVQVWKGLKPPPAPVPAGWTRIDRGVRGDLLVVPVDPSLDGRDVTVACDHGDGRAVERWTGSLAYVGCETPQTCDGSVWYAPPLPIWLNCRALSLELRAAPPSDSPVAIFPLRGFGHQLDARVMAVTGLEASLRPNGGAILEGGQAGREGLVRVLWTLPSARDLSLPQFAQVMEVSLAQDVDPAWLAYLEALP